MRKLQVTFAQMTLYTIILLLAGITLGRVTVLGETAGQPAVFSAEDHQVTTYLPAVDEDGNGVIGSLYTTVKPGSGLVLVNVNSLLAQFDTQLSGRTAAQAAARYARFDPSKIDVIYNIDVNATVIEGPSAGAAMAVSIAAALQNMTLDSRTMITGTINSDGTIGKVGGIEAKAAAAKAAGATRFLVPAEQSVEKQVTRDRQCADVGSVHYCEIKYLTKDVNIGDKLGIEVVEVSSVKEAIENFAS